MGVGHKKAEASPALLSGVRSDAGFFFNGWCREGFWSNGTLLNGRDGRTVNLTKFLQRPQETRKASLNLSIPTIGYAFVLEAENRPSAQGVTSGNCTNASYEIPVFMESHI